MKWVPVTGQDAYLEALDFGGDGPGVLLLHGLAGTAREWEDTAGWLTRTHHVVALEQRGHGRSERRPDDVSREAFVRDAAAAIEQLGLAPVVWSGNRSAGTPLSSLRRSGPSSSAASWSRRRRPQRQIPP
jgi:pimeloyl-ACP methyl ester carboxylesterase